MDRVLPRIDIGKFATTLRMPSFLQSDTVETPLNSLLIEENSRSPPSYTTSEIAEMQKFTSKMVAGTSKRNLDLQFESMPASTSVEPSSSRSTPGDSLSGRTTPVEPSSTRTTPYESSSGRSTSYTLSPDRSLEYEPSSGRTSPSELTPGRSLEYEPSSGRSTPVDSLSGRTTPVEPSSTRTTPYEPSSGRSTPSELPLGRSLEYEPLSGRTSPSELTPGRSLEYEPLSGRTSPSELTPGRSLEYEPSSGRSLEYEPSSGRTSPSELSPGRSLEYEPSSGRSLEYEPSSGRTSPSELTPGRSLEYEPSSGRSLEYEPSSGRSLEYEPSSGRTSPSELSPGRSLEYEPSSGRSLEYEPSSGRSLEYEPSSGRTTPVEPSCGGTTPVEPSCGRITPVESWSSRIIPEERTPFSSLVTFWERQSGGGLGDVFSKPTPSIVNRATELPEASGDASSDPKPGIVNRATEVPEQASPFVRAEPSPIVKTEASPVVKAEPIFTPQKSPLAVIKEYTETVLKSSCVSSVDPDESDNCMMDDSDIWELTPMTPISCDSSLMLPPSSLPGVLTTSRKSRTGQRNTPPSSRSKSTDNLDCSDVSLDYSIDDLTPRRRPKLSKSSKPRRLMSLDPAVYSQLYSPTPDEKQSPSQTAETTKLQTKLVSWSPSTNVVSVITDIPSAHDDRDLQPMTPVDCSGSCIPQQSSLLEHSQSHVSRYTIENPCSSPSNQSRDDTTYNLQSEPESCDTSDNIEPEHKSRPTPEILLEPAVDEQQLDYPLSSIGQLIKSEKQLDQRPSHNSTNIDSSVHQPDSPAKLNPLPDQTFDNSWATTNESKCETPLPNRKTSLDPVSFADISAIGPVDNTSLRVMNDSTFVDDVTFDLRNESTFEQSYSRVSMTFDQSSLDPGVKDMIHCVVDRFLQQSDTSLNQTTAKTETTNQSSAAHEEFLYFISQFDGLIEPADQDIPQPESSTLDEMSQIVDTNNNISDSSYGPSSPVVLQLPDQPMLVDTELHTRPHDGDLVNVEVTEADNNKSTQVNTLPDELRDYTSPELYCHEIPKINTPEPLNRDMDWSPELDYTTRTSLSELWVEDERVVMADQQEQAESCQPSCDEVFPPCQSYTPIPVSSRDLYPEIPVTVVPDIDTEMMDSVPAQTDLTDGELMDMTEPYSPTDDPDITQSSCDSSAPLYIDTSMSSESSDSDYCYTPELPINREQEKKSDTGLPPTDYPSPIIKSPYTRFSSPSYSSDGMVTPLVKPQITPQGQWTSPSPQIAPLGQWTSPAPHTSTFSWSTSSEEDSPTSHAAERASFYQEDPLDLRTSIRESSPDTSSDTSPVYLQPASNSSVNRGIKRPASVSDIHVIPIYLNNHGGTNTLDYQHHPDFVTDNQIMPGYSNHTHLTNNYIRDISHTSPFPSVSQRIEASSPFPEVPRHMPFPGESQTRPFMYPDTTDPSIAVLRRDFSYWAEYTVNHAHSPACQTPGYQTPGYPPILYNQTLPNIGNGEPTHVSRRPTQTYNFQKTSQCMYQQQHTDTYLIPGSLFNSTVTVPTQPVNKRPRRDGPNSQGIHIPSTVSTVPVSEPDPSSGNVDLSISPFDPTYNPISGANMADHQNVTKMISTTPRQDGEKRSSLIGMMARSFKKKLTSKFSKTPTRSYPVTSNTSDLDVQTNKFSKTPAPSYPVTSNTPDLDIQISKFCKTLTQPNIKKSNTSDLDAKTDKLCKRPVQLSTNLQPDISLLNTQTDKLRKTSTKLDSTMNAALDMCETLKDLPPYIITGWLTSNYLMALIKKCNTLTTLFEYPLDQQGNVHHYIVDSCRKNTPAIFTKDLMFRVFTLRELTNLNFRKLNKKKMAAVRLCVKKQFPMLTPWAWKTKCIALVKSSVTTLFKHRVKQVQLFFIMHS